MTPTTRRLFLALSASLLCAALPAAGSEPPRVRFDTNQGSFTVELDPVKAPKSVANFLQYVADKHYDGTIFHRVIPGFVAQGGGMSPDMRQKPTRAPIPSESKNGLKNITGSIAMARTNNPDSATSQFYINLVDNGMLDHPNPDGVGYTVFGKLVSGMDVIRKIAAIPTGPGDVPRQAVIIQSATLLAAPATR